MNNKRVMKLKEAGITLVALVVTIIVLLILAGITISLVLGQNGIIERASNSKETNEMAQIKEQAEMVKADLFVAKQGANPTQSELVTAIANADYFNGSTSSGDTITTADSKYIIIVSGNLEIRVAKNGDYVPGQLVPDVTGEIDGLPEKKSADELIAFGYIPIYTVQHLKDVASEQTNYQIQDLNGNNKGTYTMAKDAKYALINDIDLSSEANFAPIKGFQGEFEGNGCTVSNLTIDRREGTYEWVNYDGFNVNSEKPAVGLFDSVRNGKVTNLAIVNADVKGKESVAGIAGQADNVIINNCYVKDSELYRDTNHRYDSEPASGGIVGFIGHNGGTITNCKVISTTNSAGWGSGICGGVYGGDIEIRNCSAVNTSNNEVFYNTGIIQYIGYGVNNVNIENCKIQGISIKNAGIVGAFTNYGNVGDNNISNCSIKGCTLKAPITNTSQSGAFIVQYGRSRGNKS